MDKAYAKMLEDAGVKGELPNLQKQAIRRSAETMTIVEWKMKESSDQMFAESANYLEQRKEKFRFWEEQLAKESEQQNEAQFANQKESVTKP